MDATPNSNGDRVTTHNSVINARAVKALLQSEGLRCSDDLILTLEAKVNTMIRQGIRGLGGLTSKTVKGDHIERGKMRADPTAIDTDSSHTPSKIKVRRGLLGGAR